MTTFHVEGYDGVSEPITAAHYVVRYRLPRGRACIYSPKVSAKLVLTGSEIYTSDDGYYVVHPGQLLITAPDEQFDFNVKSSANGCCFHFDLHHVRRLMSEMMSDDLDGAAGDAPEITTIRLPLHASQLGLSLHAVADGNCSPDFDTLSAFLAESAVYLSRLGTKLTQKRESTRRELIARLEVARAFLADAVDRSVSIQELEQVSCLSRFHLIRSFARLYGAPPLRFHQNLRLDAARVQLGAGLSQDAVAELLGFSTTSSFSRAYRRRHDRPPSADQKR